MRIFYKIITLIFTIWLFTLTSNAKVVQYYTYLNQFGAFKQDDTTIDDKILIHSNINDTTKFNIISISKIKTPFTFFVRIANNHNKEGKTIKINKKDGKQQKIHRTSWGLIWGYNDPNNYYAIALNGNNNILNEVLDERSIEVEIFRLFNGEKHILCTQNLSKGVNLQDGFNNILIKYNGHHTQLSIGSKKMQHIATLDIPYQDSLSVGYFAGPGAKIEIDHLVTKKPESKKSKLQTSWNKDKIDNYLITNKTDLLEGLWTYQDRNINESTTKLGGKYTLAIIKNEQNGYDILYYDGAKVNAPNWQCGMLKGKLIRTKFADNFDLVWYDAMMNKYDDDTYADIEAYTILSLNIPNRKAQLRFTKQ